METKKCGKQQTQKSTQDRRSQILDYIHSHGGPSSSRTNSHHLQTSHDKGCCNLDRVFSRTSCTSKQVLQKSGQCTPKHKHVNRDVTSFGSAMEQWQRRLENELTNRPIKTSNISNVDSKTPRQKTMIQRLNAHLKKTTLKCIAQQQVSAKSPGALKDILKELQKLGGKNCTCGNCRAVITILHDQEFRKRLASFSPRKQPKGCSVLSKCLSSRSNGTQRKLIVVARKVKKSPKGRWPSVNSQGLWPPVNTLYTAKPAAKLAVDVLKSMEMRAAERKLRRAQLKELQEKNQARLIQMRQQIEADKRLAKHRKTAEDRILTAVQQPMERAKEAQQAHLKWNRAVRFRNLFVLRTYGWNPWMQFVQECQRQNLYAQVRYDRFLKRYGLRVWRHRTASVALEIETKTVLLYTQRLKKIYFSKWVDFQTVRVILGAMAEQHYLHRCLRRIFRAWYFYTIQLQPLRVKQHELVDNLNKRRLLRLALRRWRHLPVVNEAERIRENRLNILRQRVHEYLPDYSHCFDKLSSLHFN